MRVLVFSDLHAVSRRPEKGAVPSLIEFSNTDRTSTRDPLVGLKSLLEQGIVAKPNLIICAGDIADKADAVATRSAWIEINDLATACGIRDVLATCGNHDLDSRHSGNSFDPKGFLRRLTPSFPMPKFQRSDMEQLRYWADNFSIVEGPSWRVLNINSCAYHGYGSEAKPELDHGRISDHTLNDIKDAIGKFEGLNEKINICLLHHHLKEISSDTFKDKSKMEGAENLLATLAESKYGEWFVVHGHRYRAGIYCAGGNTAPIVLSCASFSATLAGDEQNPSPNQFYMIEFESRGNGRARVKGIVRSWNWTPSYGWLEASPKPGGLPSRAGFGFRGDILDLADKVAEEVLMRKRISWDDLQVSYPDIKFLIPGDIDNFAQSLATMLDIYVSRDGAVIREILVR